MEIVKGKIGNALESVAPDHILGVTADIYDEEREQYQSDINEGVGRTVENPEFLKVYTDSDGKFLCGIQRDGNVVFGVGVPQQIKDYILDKIAEKVDKVEGKSLIDAGFAEGITYIENPEFLCVYLDADDHVLWGIRRDGSVVFSNGSTEELKAAVKLLAATKVDKEDGKSLIDAEVAESFSIEDNPEYIKAVTDSEGKLLAGIKKDGKFWLNDLELDGKTFYGVTDSLEWFVAWIDDDNHVLMGIRRDGSVYPASADTTEIEQEISAINEMLKDVDWDAVKSGTILADTEGRLEVTTDKNGKTLSYRSADGVKHEQMLKVEKQLTLGKEAITDFEKQLGWRQVSILGDSISTYNKKGYKIDGYKMYYPSGDVQNVNDTWWMLFINTIGARLDVNASYSGSWSSSGYIGFSSRAGMLDNPDIIFVELGTNDSGEGIDIGTINYDSDVQDESKFAPSYIKGVQTLLENYPDATIVCLAFDMTDEYADVIEDIAEHYNLIYIDVRDVISGKHPDKSGMYAAYSKILDSCSNILTDNEKNNASINRLREATYLENLLTNMGFVKNNI